jgi:hypothetical protein
MVGGVLPVQQRGRGGIQRGKALASPELLVIDARAAFDFAVLFRTPRFNVAEANASLLHGECEGEGELRPIVNLHFANRKREGVANGGQELQPGEVVLAGIEAEDPKPSAVIEGGGLEPLRAGGLNLLDVHLDRIAGALFAEEGELAGAAFQGAAERRVAEVAADPVDRGGGNTKAVDALQPDPRANGAKLEVAAGLLNEDDRRRRNATGTAGGIAGD